jgi:hypothetical protein
LEAVGVDDFFSIVKDFYCHYILSLYISRMSATKSRRKGPRKPLLIFFPVEVIEQINRAVEVEDTDRSKFIRKAVKNALRMRHSA